MTELDKSFNFSRLLVRSLNQREWGKPKVNLSVDTILGSFRNCQEKTTHEESYFWLIDEGAVATKLFLLRSILLISFRH